VTSPHLGRAVLGRFSAGGGGREAGRAAAQSRVKTAGATSQGLPLTGGPSPRHPKAAQHAVTVSESRSVRARAPGSQVATPRAARRHTVSVPTTAVGPAVPRTWANSPHEHATVDRSDRPRNTERGPAGPAARPGRARRRARAGPHPLSLVGGPRGVIRAGQATGRGARRKAPGASASSRARRARRRWSTGGRRRARRRARR
jgi:hypothetical protein